MNIVGKKIGLSTQVFSAMILGAVFGLLFGGVMVKLEFIGTIWLNCIKMIVVPMVLMTIITGITSQKDLKSLGRIAVRIMVYYVLTTLVATVIGLATASVLKPGVHANFTGLATSRSPARLTSPSRSSSRICSPPICSSPSLRATSCKPSSSQ